MFEFDRLKINVYPLEIVYRTTAIKKKTPSNRFPENFTQIFASATYSTLHLEIQKLSN